MIRFEIPLNCYEYDALKEELQKSGKDAEEEIDKIIASYYAETVPLEKRQQAERKMHHFGFRLSYIW